jgi:hypothetical protein
MRGIVMAMVVVGLGGPASAAESAATRPAGVAAFERLKALAGEWSGHVQKPDGPKATVQYRVASNGSVVMETLFPGTDHEMISMYHLDGHELVLTHYCAMANQPRMRLASASSSSDELRFEFVGGTNLDAQKSTHVHDGRIAFKGGDRLEAEWTVYSEGKPAGANKFFLTRAAAPAK